MAVNASGILTGAVPLGEDLVFESLIYQNQLTKYPGGKLWGLCLNPVVGVCKGTFLAMLVSLLYEVL